MIWILGAVLSIYILLSLIVIVAIYCGRFDFEIDKFEETK